MFLAFFSVFVEEETLYTPFGSLLYPITDFPRQCIEKVLILLFFWRFRDFWIV